MNDAVFLERRYRWLLGWYPASFRKENEDEVLGVLMASARDGKRWPSTLEAADVLWSALRMRFRLPPAGSEDPGWSDAWAVFSIVAPVFLLVTNLVVVKVPPHFLHVRSSGPWFNVNVAPHYSWLGLGYEARAFYILLLYPYTIEFASVLFGSGSYGDLLQFGITPFHLAVLFLRPLVVAVLTILIAARRRLASSDARLTPGS